METATSPDGATAMARLALRLRALTEALDPASGWYGEFLRRDPEGMRACLDAVAVPPWDVLESLLADLAAALGPEHAAAEAAVLAPLRAAAAAAYDRRPAAAGELRGTLARTGAQRAASEAAVHGLAARLAAAGDPEEARFLSGELAWTRDDLARAESRCADLSARLSALARPGPAAREASPRAAGPPPRTGLPGVPAQPGPTTAPDSTPTPTPGAPQVPAPAHELARPPGPGPDPDPGQTYGSGSGSGSGPGPGAGAAAAGQPVPRLVAGLTALRGQGRTGEAHALLCEAAGWPAALLPGLARELERAGLAADWATLLWEAAAGLPPERLAESAAALGAAGREEDRDRLLRLGVARPPAEIAEAALALDAAGRAAEAEALLDAFVRVRTAEEAARLARRDPQWFGPRLLEAARRASGNRHRDLKHALRVAGIR
ncbi:hypothetical protein [Streptomyces sp. NPDC012888]|uniref:hypothetical protein n=1 Tax=Streptomyces sp. NPDC012888 TaxID=3364855 RepID=UPI0036938A58